VKAVSVISITEDYAGGDCVLHDLPAGRCVVPDYLPAGRGGEVCCPGRFPPPHSPGST
jgi:hypothetical protein